MKLLSLRQAVTFALAATALLALGCSDDSVKPPPPQPCKYYCYKPLTEKENLVYNLMLCYREHRIDRYDELLHPDFVWYNQQGVTPGHYTRSEDIELTGNMFLAAEDKYPDEAFWIDKLELSIVQQGQYWTRVDNLGGTPCDDCWETTREYYLTLVMAGGEVTYIANDLVKFIVVPVEVNGTKVYRIRRCDDLRKQ